MTVRLTCTTPEAVAYHYGRPKCPCCGSIVLIAEESAFNLRGRIRHAWACDECSHEFVTSIPLWSR
jgi:hypothetical protein